MTSSRILPVLATGVLALGLLAGCAPTPEPKPTKTAAFASDEEAFAAAEETYEAYIAATNEVDMADPNSFEAVFEWLSGKTLGAEKKSLSEYHAEGLVRDGVTKFDTFTPVAYTDGEVTAELCIDVSGVSLNDSNGAPIAPTERIARQAAKVRFVPGDTSTGLLINSHTRAEQVTC